jgi:beta-glucosidase
LRLPENQLDYLQKMRANAKKLVVVLLGGSPIAIPEVHELADAVLFAWYPGQEGGRAVADVLFGDESPSGRLPITFPKSTDQLPPYEDYSMAGRTYRYMTEEPLYPFGFGLGYTTFRYGPLQLSKQAVGRGEGVTARVVVTNSGSRPGDEVVQLYATSLAASGQAPRSTLKGIRRVRLDPAQSATVEFAVDARSLAVINNAGQEVAAKGDVRLVVGPASPGTRAVALGVPEPVQAVLSVR